MRYLGIIFRRWFGSSTVVSGAGGGGPSGPTDGVLLEDGVSFILLEDGVSYMVQE